MQEYYIRDTEQAKAIVNAYEHCSNCSTCCLDTVEGWRCSYINDRAVEYLAKHADQ